MSGWLSLARGWAGILARSGWEETEMEVRLGCLECRVAQSASSFVLSTTPRMAAICKAVFGSIWALSCTGKY